jgi:ketosteroid isomerase-like protein
MEKRNRLGAWSAVASLAVLALVVGCSSDTCTCPEDVGDTGYPDQSTPDNAIQKLEMAYESMDADAYMECLAEDFLYFLNPDDLDDNPYLPPYWDKAEERTIAWNMFADTTAVGSIDLTLTVVSRDSLPGEDLWEYEVDVDLTVEAGTAYLSSGLSLFVMRRSPDHLQTTWQIIEHHDLGEDGIQRENTTWTAIKLLFGGSAVDSLYPLRTSAANVLRKLNIAYERMDAEAYLDCLAEDFIFFLNPDDLTDYPELPEYWDKVEEATIHGNMFVSVSEQFDQGDPGDPTDDTWVYLESVDLRMQLPPDLTLLVQVPQQFTLGVDPEETGLGGELLWEITRWHDISAEAGRYQEPMVEHASWGLIKAMYR